VWRRIRIGVLLVVLVIAAGESWSDRFITTRWTNTLWIGLFPIDGDGHPATGRYIEALDRGQFTAIEEFVRREAARFGQTIDEPVRVELYPAVGAPPPQLDPDAGMASRLWWNLQLLYYSWRMGRDALADIRIFVIYHDPEVTPSVPHSLGLQKGLVGVVYAFAAPAMDATNNIVIAHELLHTLGASDKYDPASGLPEFPDGYGEPGAEPRYPQQYAEIMAGKTALDADEAEMPGSLDEAVVGYLTAQEIGWLR
jgi:hypothetical protein